eukprot:scaffold124484_cov29-Tisochrysis_lutea.AAC.2
MPEARNPILNARHAQERSLAISCANGEGHGHLGADIVPLRFAQGGCPLSAPCADCSPIVPFACAKTASCFAAPRDCLVDISPASASSASLHSCVCYCSAFCVTGCCRGWAAHQLCHARPRLLHRGCRLN